MIKGKNIGNADSLSVNDQVIPVVAKALPQSSLLFYPENPRVYSVLRADGGEPTQEEIYETLSNQEHVAELIQDIRRHGGLIEPIYVRDGTMHVLEGNSRLAAYRFLAKKEPMKWATIKCIVLPEDISESLVAALLSQFHIKGKKEWAPFEQAGYFYRRHKVEKIDLDQLHQEMGLSKQKINHLISTYQFMIDHKQREILRWSYFDEYLKSNKIKRAREKHPGLDAIVVKKINSKEIQKAVEIRDELPLVCGGPPRVLKRFVEEKLPFSQAVEQAKDAGGDNTALKKLEKFRGWIVLQHAEKELLRAEGQQLPKILFELKKISTRIGVLSRRLDKRKEK